MLTHVDLVARAGACLRWPAFLQQPQATAAPTMHLTFPATPAAALVCTRYELSGEVFLPDAGGLHLAAEPRTQQPAQGRALREDGSGAHAVGNGAPDERSEGEGIWVWVFVRMGRCLGALCRATSTPASALLPPRGPCTASLIFSCWLLPLVVREQRHTHSHFHTCTHTPPWECLASHAGIPQQTQPLHLSATRPTEHPRCVPACLPACLRPLAGALWYA